MATIDLRFWDGSEWVSVGDVAADKVVLPTNVSAFTNDAGYVTQDAIDTTVADYLPLAGGTMTGSIAGIAGSATVQSVSVGKSGTGIHGSSAYDRLFIATNGERRVMVNEAGEISLGDWGANAASIGSGVRVAPERTGTGTVRGVAIATQFDGAAADAQNVFVGGSIAAGTSQYTAMRFPQPAGATPQNMIGIFFEPLSGSTESVCIESQANAGTGAWFIKSTGTLPSYHAGQIQTALGTAAAPSVSFFGDTDTGTFSPATDTWAVSTGGVERLRIGAEGHAGLGVPPATTVGIWVGQKLEGSSVASIMTTAPIDSAVATAVYNRVRFDLMAGAAVGNLRGFSVDSQSFAGSAADVCGYYCETLPAGTGKTWAFYAATNKSYFGGQVQTGLGTAAAPSVSIFGDEDTGTFSPAADTWAVSTDGVERLRVDGNGAAAVGTTVSANTALRVGTTTSALTGSVQYGMLVSAQGNADCTNTFMGVRCSPTVQDTNAKLYHFTSYFQDGVNEQYGLLVGHSGAVPTSVGRCGIRLSLPASYADWAIYSDTNKPSYFLGQVQTGLGTASAPSVSTYGDTDTGTFSPGADQWAVSCGGVERLRVDGTKIHAKTYVDFFDPAGDLAGRLQATSTTFYVQSLGASRNFVFRQNGVDALTITSTQDVNIWQSIRAASGTASAPGFAIRGDEDTGTFSPASDTWAVSCGGVERLRVDGNGDLLAATGYTPATPQSLATKAYVDGNASSSGAVTLYQVVTPSEYAALTEYDPHVMYLVTENDQTAPPVDQNNALAHTIVTRTEFDALPTKDEHTIYIIKG